LFLKKYNIKLKTAEEIEKMRVAGKVVGEILFELSSIIKPGITTKYIDDFVENYIRSLNMIPAFLGVDGTNYPFPASACISVNNEIVHGIPNTLRILEFGDIVSVDIGVIYQNYYSDASKTYAVGNISNVASKLIRITELSLYKGIEQILPGNRIGDISNAIQKTVEDSGFFVVKNLVGHGIGKELHEDPQIPNYGEAGVGIKLLPGMVFAIEPMVNVGTCDVCTLDNGWTIVTKDGSLSAHFEHTVAITEFGYEILTRGYNI
jgi:methionyl aminopeptidase